ncbi:hypothetical protein PAXRUDRAFT_431362 [Paxillus rubicundulus Ve08.2h10]|uniref:Uncharacterized protein n=1 Tax=Paxillus rubicundulus Ve08.2h10 TaxID=930991 RepID=A0A0D0DBY7_9AGAM|nr:hypothetical protein PAXRUDRAFT_431362 [Paxillus rubicundulus Ve08.2h10]
MSLSQMRVPCTPRNCAFVCRKAVGCCKHTASSLHWFPSFIYFFCLRSENVYNTDCCKTAAHVFSVTPIYVIILSYTFRLRPIPLSVSPLVGGFQLQYSIV